MGLMVGSFLNVVIYRVPRKESVVKPRSRCPGCGTQLSSLDNIPVVSWLVLRGKCRTCGTAISIRYPLIELLTGVLFAAGGARYPHPWGVPPVLFVPAGLIADSGVDPPPLLLPHPPVCARG